MPEVRFEVRLLGDTYVAVGEKVQFEQVDGKMYALNEDDEPFGVVPSRYASLIAGAYAKGYSSWVESKSGACPLVVVYPARTDMQSRPVSLTLPSVMEDGQRAEEPTQQARAMRQREDDQEGDANNAAKKSPDKIYTIGAVFVAAFLLALLVYLIIPTKSGYVSDRAFNLGVEAVEVVESYLNGEMNCTAAYNQLVEIWVNVRSSYDLSGKYGDKRVSSCLLALCSEFAQLQASYLSDDVEPVPDDEIREDLKKLKSVIYSSLLY